MPSSRVTPSKTNSSLRACSLIRSVFSVIGSSNPRNLHRLKNIFGVVRVFSTALYIEAYFWTDRLGKKEKPKIDADVSQKDCCAYTRKSKSLDSGGSSRTFGRTLFAMEGQHEAIP